jgi:uncharacterized protein YjbI with pentapeptide repeats
MNLVSAKLNGANLSGADFTNAKGSIGVSGR